MTDIDTSQMSADEKLAAEWAAATAAAEAPAGEMSADEKLALEWANATSGGAPADDPMAALMGKGGKVLNQDEIDSLLGFDSNKKEDNNIGIQAMLDKALSSYERLPMLEVVFDRLVRMMSTSLRNLTSDNVDVSLESINSLRFGDYINSVPLPALLTIFKAVEWENYGMISANSQLIFSMLDVLLGGRRSDRPVKVEGRPYTTIEQDVVKKFTEVMLSDMSAAFDPLSPVTFKFERQETNPRFATIARPANAAILVTLRVDMETRGGILEIMLPYATLEPIKELLLQMFMGEKFGRDSVWEGHLGNEVRSTSVKLSAVLGQKRVMMRDIVNLRVGSTIVLDKEPDEEITLLCGGVPMMSGKLGKMGDHKALKVTDIINKRMKEML
jgi:flagellar motor switch protein FliM